MFVCVSLVSQGLADLWAPPLKQGDIGVKAAFVDTVHCESILPHLLIRTHSQTPSSSTTFSREAETRRPLEPRFIFNIAFFSLSPPASLHIVTSLQSARISTPETPPIIPQNVPFPPPSALHLLFSCSPGSSPLSSP